MNSSFKKTIKIFLLLLFMYLFSSKSVYAASVAISSKDKVSPGEKFTVTITANNSAGYLQASTSNGSGNLSIPWIENESKSFTCTAGETGQVSITVTGVVSSFSTGEDEKINISKSVQIEEKSTKTTKTSTTKATTSSKTKTEKEEEKEDEIFLLESLEIEDANFETEFNSEVYEYYIDTEDKLSLNINAKANTDNAIIEVLGNENLKIGENIITINLKGQDDKKITTYTLKIINRKSEFTLVKEQISELQQKNEKLKSDIYILIVIAIISIFFNILFLTKKNKGE